MIGHIWLYFLILEAKVLIGVNAKLSIQVTSICVNVSILSCNQSMIASTCNIFDGFSTKVNLLGQIIILSFENFLLNQIHSSFLHCYICSFLGSTILKNKGVPWEICGLHVQRSLPINSDWYIKNTPSNTCKLKVLTLIRINVFVSLLKTFMQSKSNFMDQMILDSINSFILEFQVYRPFVHIFMLTCFIFFGFSD